MGSALLGWFAKEGVGLVLGALGKLMLDYFNERRADQALKRAGAAEAANEVNVETLETRDAMDRVARPSDDAVADSMRDGKF